MRPQRIGLSISLQRDKKNRSPGPPPQDTTHRLNSKKKLSVLLIGFPSLPLSVSAGIGSGLSYLLLFLVYSTQTGMLEPPVFSIVSHHDYMHCVCFYLYPSLLFNKQIIFSLGGRQSASHYQKLFSNLYYYNIFYL